MSQNDFTRVRPSDRTFILLLFLSSFFTLYSLSSPLSYDEYFALYHIEGLGFGDILFPFQGLSDPHPPFYYFFMKCLFTVLPFPHTSFWLRLPSLIFSAGYLVFLHEALKSRMDIRSLRLGLLLVLVSSFFVTYAREARMYSLNIFFLAVTFWGISSDKSVGQKLGRLAAVLAGITHFSSLLYLPIIFILSGRREGRMQYRKLSLDFLTLVPGLFYLWLKSVARSELFSYHLAWVPAPGIKSLRKIFLDTFIHNDYSYHLPVPEIIVICFMLISFVLISLALVKSLGQKQPSFAELLFLMLVPIPVSLIYFYVTGISVVYPRGYGLGLVLFPLVWIWAWKIMAGFRIQCVVTLILGAFLCLNLIIWNPFYAHRKESSPEDLGTILRSHPGTNHVRTCSKLLGFYEFVLLRETGRAYKVINEWKGFPEEIWWLESWCEDKRVTDLKAHYPVIDVYPTSSFGVTLTRFRQSP